MTVRAKDLIVILQQAVEKLGDPIVVVKDIYDEEIDLCSYELEERPGALANIIWLIEEGNEMGGTPLPMVE